ncbi:zinc finger CCHC domain-containing protein 9 isoform X1 [Podarcis raffonei]|uniref:zinc finger CCHC domain-containing protein 9 isoform X1 n=1 Tax=Podarcis raffonei TaxID=65483 RepID=UPI002329994E|nr:zinc finger CCHC domain-containing protein 9 isoform X1 [Podarcis raffonei]XP_053265209.1 zinc finger CCHC domain-containing protein 9 isoform X1 [Podarcis raffonei]XP_053265210.1 zinc finger CCHC domain-containing protein 9 isoform X1 [Podarcis raffonei]XP_053265211.1 zinc finger CCHC domain-containing protein 9 isoform X1 [Podarcis raffonei]XP_053265212.1 zinc finger CCHC domain-containing protein 9 isoform X1 [Podarcis raffonei]XP_053265213.1 zinc finger CCHC domain-containing protein 9 
MTRWARANVTHNKKALDATPWEHMKNDATGSATTDRKQSSSNNFSLRSTQGKKKNKKKKDYMNEDVNGFMEYLKQNSQTLHKGEVINSREAKDEIATALKKDRRREGRRVKRQEMKKNTMVCFHCRKPGHGVADCPAVLESQDMGTGICYRCGSTEHEINKCRAKIDPALGEFPYAKCFICGEMGHLSRSCPDNPKGLYAEGGACRICGSVEHFKKDCPENQNADRVATVGRWLKGMSADYQEVLDSPKPQKPKPKIAKVVNF